MRQNQRLPLAPEKLLESFFHHLDKPQIRPCKDFQLGWPIRQTPFGNFDSQRIRQPRITMISIGGSHTRTIG
jgi:hypothetical protein